MKLNWILKIVPTLVLGLAAIGLAQAQTTPPAPTTPTTVAKPAHGMKAINGILAKMNLTKDQHNQVKALEKAHKADLKAYKEANPGGDIVDKSGHKAHNQQAMATFMTGLKGVLTPAQWNSFETQYKATQVKKKKAPKPVTPPPAN